MINMREMSNDWKHVLIYNYLIESRCGNEYLRPMLCCRVDNVGFYSGIQNHPVRVILAGEELALCVVVWRIFHA